MTDSTVLVEVHILGLPVALRERSTQHGDELVREMTLIVSREADGVPTRVPERLVRLAAEVRGAYGQFTQHPTERIDAAAEAGVEVIDEIVYRVPAEAGQLCEHILQVIDETDAFCREGQYLLALATPPDVRAYQRWMLGEFIRQGRGERPLSWEAFCAQADA